MSWRLLQLGLFALAFALGWPAPSEGAPRTEPLSCAATEGTAGPSTPADGGEQEQARLRRPGPPLPGTPGAERSRPPRVELRQPGLESWRAPVNGAAAGLPPGALAILRPAPGRCDGPRLHVLLCTWLN